MEHHTAHPLPGGSVTEATEAVEERHESVRDGGRGSGLRFTKTAFAFFLMGLLIGLPATVTGAAASSMFDGITGVFEVCNSVVAAAASFATPFLLRRFSYRTSIIVCSITTVLSYLICTLPNPMSTDAAESKAGPAIGAMIGGFVHAFGISILLSLAAFFPQEAVLALSAGNGLAVLVGPGTLIGILAGFDQAWRRSLLVYTCTGFVVPAVWCFLMDKARRAAAEENRLATREGRSSKSKDKRPSQTDPESIPEDKRPNVQDDAADRAGQRASRLRLVFKTLLPKYLLAFLLLCISANVSTMGSAPTLQHLRRFRKAPKGDMQFQLIFLASGIGNFLFSTLAGIRPKGHVWGWTALETGLCVIGVIQVVAPFLTYYGVWVMVMFFIGGGVGVGRTNTFYGLAEEFRVAGHDDATRSFAMGFAGAGNFVGDALGGTLAVMMEYLATRDLTRTKW